MKTKILQGALFSLLGFTFFACSDALSKLAGLENVPLTFIVMLSGAIAALTVFIYSAARNNLASLRPKKWKNHAVLTTLSIIQSYVALEAFTNLPLTTVYIGIFASPFLISLYGRLFMGEHLSKKQWIAIAVGFVGVILALVPEFRTSSTQELGDPMRGYLALPLFVLAYVAAMLVLRVMGRDETAESITFVSMLGRAILLLPLFFFIPFPTLPLETWFYMIGIGITVALGFILMSRAYQLAPVAVVSPLHYSQLVTGAILGYLIWETVPHYWVFIGGVIIITSGLMIAREAHRLGQKDLQQ